MLTIGLTGGMGSGKSTAARWFNNQGVPVLDADKTVHRLLQSDSSTISKVIEEFGPEILGDNGQIVRSKLGERIFYDDNARKCLERIVHPRVLELMSKEQAALKDSGVEVAVWDVPLLFEAGLENFVDKVWVVWIPIDLQIQRVLRRDKLSKEDAQARIAAQWPLDDKCKLADVVIDNSGNESETQRQLEEAWKKLLLEQGLGQS